MILTHPARGNRDQRQPEQEMEVGPKNRPGHPIQGMEHMVVVVPIDAQINEAQDVAQEQGNQRPEGLEIMAARDFQLQNHNRDDDGNHTVTEGF